MKKRYAEPELEVIKVYVEEIMTTSNENLEVDDGGSGDGLLDN